MAGFNDDARRDDVRAKVSNYRMHPWGQRVQEHDPAVPDGQTCRTGRLTENVVIGKDDVQQSSLHLGHRYRSTIDGYRRSNVDVGLARTIPQLGFSGAIPLERAALERGCRDEDLGAGLYRARLDTAGRERRDRAAKVKARERGPTAAEGVLGIRCLKHRRPQRSEVIVKPLLRDGAGCGCDQAEHHDGGEQHCSEPEHNMSEPPNVTAHDDSPPSASAPPSSASLGTISFGSLGGCETREAKSGLTSPRSRSGRGRPRAGRGHCPGNAVAHFTGADDRGRYCSVATPWPAPPTSTGSRSCVAQLPLSAAVAMVASQVLVLDFDPLYDNIGDRVASDAWVRRSKDR